MIINGTKTVQELQKFTTITSANNRFYIKSTITGNEGWFKVNSNNNIEITTNISEASLFKMGSLYCIQLVSNNYYLYATTPTTGSISAGTTDLIVSASTPASITGGRYNGAVLTNDANKLNEWIMNGQNYTIAGQITALSINNNLVQATHNTTPTKIDLPELPIEFWGYVNVEVPQEVSFPGISKIYVGTQLVYQKQAQITPSVLFSSTSNNISLNVINNTKYWDGTLETSTDCITWTTWDGTTTVSSNTGKIYVRGSNNTVITGSTASETAGRWQLTGTAISISGNIEALLDYQTVAGGSMVANPATRAFYGLIRKNANIIDASNLELPRTALVTGIYMTMFYSCTGLINAPALPATVIAADCYRSMFYGCSSLATAPALPATTLANDCYRQMFFNCTSLTATPTLSATTLAINCYYGMFKGCSSLTTISALPATTLANGCYEQMFHSCTSLAVLPALPAITLADGCYNNMFTSCSNIKLSTTQTGEYVNAYRIPPIGTATVGSGSLNNMFAFTGGTFTGQPYANTTYYTSNTIVNPQ